MEKYINKAKVLIEALPYIKQFSGKIVVIKYGGSAMTNDVMRASTIQDIVLLKLVGLQPVIVHGGGNMINDTLDRMGKEHQFIEGLRVTDQDTVEVVEMVLSGRVNKEIVQHFQNNNVQAVGMSGKDGGTLLTKKLKPNGVDIGFVGEIEQINTELIYSLLSNDFVPVIAPLGSDKDGQTYNINGDYAAAAIAGALQAEKLVLLTDTHGIRKNPDDPTSFIQRLSIAEAEVLMQSETITGGMIPKLTCCIDAIKQGVQAVHILDGRIQHSLLLEVFTQTGIGTMIRKEVFNG